MDYDVIIVGGGMVGLALAAALKNTKLQIALIDASSSPFVQDERLIALNDASVCLFENMGIWPLLASHAAPIKQVHVSQRGRFGITRIDAGLLNLQALGYVVPAKYINIALENHLALATNIHIMKPATLKAISQDAKSVRLSIKTTTGLSHYMGRLVVGADGSHSSVRTLLNIPTETMDYQQTALVTITHLLRDHEGIAYERFLDEGALAMLPLPGMEAATIWTTTTEYATKLMLLSDQEFLSLLQKHFGYRLGRLLSIEKRATYPLTMIKAKYQRQQHVWLIGNAAHTLHPIAAQGLNLALYEVALLVTALCENDFSCMENLDSRRFNQMLSHKLTWLFSSDLFLLNQVRQAGLVGLDLLPSLKKRFAARAIGRGGFVPTLLTRNNQ